MSPNAIASAKAAGLRYVADETPGIQRRMGPLGFEYTRPHGGRIRIAAELKRIARLAIPPAWTDVWICPDPRGHLQATGRDARGRKQYRYHPDWRATRDETKYDRMLAFAGALPSIRSRTTADLARPGLPREKVLATVVQLLAKSFIRVGNEEYARQNGSVGLTTMQDKHVEVRGSRVRFEFRGKSGIRHAVDVDDRRLARIVKHCRDLPGQELFQYLDDDGTRRKVDSGDVNAYLKTITGEDFTAKDFRTWAGTVLACMALKEMAAEARERADDAQSRGRSGKAQTARGRGRVVGRANGKTAGASAKPSGVKTPSQVLRAIDAVAGLLGNTRAVCRKSYIHPAIFDAYSDGTLIAVCVKSSRGRAQGLTADECAVVTILKKASQVLKKKAA